MAMTMAVNDGEIDADVEIFQSFHITDDAGEQVSAFVVHQTGGGEGFELFIEPNAQTGEQTESNIVRNEAFEVTEDAARDAEESHANHRDAEISNGWMKRCCGDQPGRCANECNAGADGEGAKQDGECNPVPGTVEELE